MAQAQKLSPEVLDELKKVASIYGMIQTDYVTPVDGTVVLASCMKGMLNKLDLQSAYMEKDEFEDFMRGPPKDLVGIGVEIVIRAGLPTVVSAIEGSPASRSGLRPKDYIMEIDGHSMEESEARDAVKRLRGKPGTTVNLTIRRPGEMENRSLTLIREPSYLRRVSSRRAPFDIGYLRIPSVNESTAPDVRAEFRKLQATGPLRGLVLDLRNSPGGLLLSSIELAAMFLPPDAPIVSTEGRLSESNRAWTANRDEILKGGYAKRDDWPDAMKSVPLVVLVNAGTASGVEIIAAALRDNNRAKLMGSKTFGRGTIQTLRPLSKDSAVKLTTAFYKTPSGRQLQGNGLEPDVQAPDLQRMEDAGTDQDAGLIKAINLLRAPS
ncbi:C-terminal processing peptidase [Polaromonas sp. CF318]|uniref:S41 family peptidase n=1 Tax=Polaromonas sp. CF318 TaxID=1144318 RepID=UPI000271178A|nr:S41 family peptidase [Polaromonas sp. CF318]EJL86305.1 C-terminal processing peptidase [Polaromonas sp. CF318]